MRAVPASSIRIPSRARVEAPSTFSTWSSCTGDVTREAGIVAPDGSLGPPPGVSCTYIEPSRSLGTIAARASPLTAYPWFSWSHASTTSLPPSRSEETVPTGTPPTFTCEPVRSPSALASSTRTEYDEPPLRISTSTTRPATASPSSGS